MLGVPKSVQNSLGDHLQPMVLRESVKRFRRVNRWERRAQEASVTGGPENVARHDSSLLEAVTDHFKQLMHCLLVEVVKHLRHPDKIKGGVS